MWTYVEKEEEAQVDSRQESPELLLDLVPSNKSKLIRGPKAIQVSLTISHLSLEFRIFCKQKDRGGTIT